jgi:hypothetical protein
MVGGNFILQATDSSLKEADCKIATSAAVPNSFTKHSAQVLCGELKEGMRWKKLKEHWMT